MEIIGFIAAIIIGIILGILGGGGSILSVPILVYLFKLDSTTATAYSLFIVGTSSLIGTFPKYKQNLIDFKVALIFGTPALFSVFLTRKYLIPAIPDEIIQISNFVITKSLLTMFVFAILMISASFSMIKKTSKNTIEEGPSIISNYSIILFQGLILGLLTGFVGAGGGFLIIPALMYLCNIPIKKAIGTSFVIIAANSLLGFMADLTNNHTNIDWKFLLTFTTLAITGIFIGSYLTKYIDAQKLKKGFGWFVLSMGIYIIIHEILF